MSENEGTFLGVPACDLAKPLPAADVIIVGARDATPYDPGCGSHAANAPKAIRRVLTRYEHDLLRWDFDQNAPLLDLQRTSVLDAGDIGTDPVTPERNREAITTNIRRIIDNGSAPVVLGGDDSVPIPVFAAFEGQGDITIIQIDAHLDWREAATSA
jgi:agmatinase